MAVARMKKVTIVGHRSVLNEVVSALQDMGCVQVTDLRESLTPEDAASLGGRRGRLLPAAEADEAADGADARLSRVAHCIAYIERFETARKGLIESFIGQKTRVPASRLREILEGFDEVPLYESCVADEHAATQARADRARLESQVAALRGWAALDLPLRELGERAGVCAIAASCSVTEYSLLEEDLRGAPVHLQQVGESAGTARFVAFCFSGDRDVAEAFARHGVSRVSFGDLEGTPASILADAESRLREIEVLEKQITERGIGLLKHKLDLLVLHDYLSGIRSREQVKEKFAETGAAFAVQGWVKANRVKDVEARLGSVSEAVEVIAEDPGPDDDVPVALENHPLIQPFEVVTNIYGWPKYGEQDPTPLLAPFFFVFFGLALTDAAYGIVLALAFWYLMRKYRVPKDGRKFFVLMIYGGISTTIFGAMAGGWFGNLIEFAPKGMVFLRRFREAFFVFDPMIEPLKFMIVSLALGVVQVWFGILVKMVSGIRAGSARDALCDQLPWLILIPSLVMMAVSSAGIFASLYTLFSRLAAAAALAVVVTQGRNTKSILAKPFVGLYALYGGVGYFSDVLSYTRLLALGLATGVIGNVINQIGDLAKMIPILGYLIGAVILVGGHAFNLVINVLGAFIHSGRLQFVEFFTKFFEGGGRGFTPFKRESKYVIIE
ncbi:MAG: V-type ATP synthase subunit I [Firmicutes bacterium]|jgi:V/A-type H+-transporting ATPase subunit I|nr:V-type ATP synthase subunit I [Bacillota bacterium]